MNETQVLELFFDSKGEAVEGKSGDKSVIWKDILREGEFPVTPGRKRKIPFRVVPTGKTTVTKDLITISMSDVMASHEAKAFESVTMIVMTIISSIRVKPRSRFVFRFAITRSCIPCRRARCPALW